jgi:hypothetical protein
MRPGSGRRPPTSGLPEVGFQSAQVDTADLRWLALIKEGSR